jgi:hypothetical protein
VPERVNDHAQRVARFAIEVIGEAGLVLSPATGKPLQVRFNGTRTHAYTDRQTVRHTHTHARARTHTHT